MDCRAWRWRLAFALASSVMAAPGAADTGSLERIAAGKAISIAYAPNAYPLSFRDASGMPRGYAIDLCRRIVEGVQRELGLGALEVAWIEGNAPRRLAAVANGEVDLECGPTPVTLGHQAVVDFSNIVFVESAALLVRRDAGIAAVADLAGRRVGVVPETSTERRLRAALAAAGLDATLAPIIDARDGRERLAAGALDAVAGDRLVLLGQIATAPLDQSGGNQPAGDEPAGDGAATDGQALAIIDGGFSVEPYAFAVPRNDANFRLSVNRALAEVYRDGEVDRIFRRWFGADSEPTTLLATIWFIYGFAD